MGQAHHALVDGIAAMEVALLLFGPPPPGGAPEPWRPARPRPGFLPALPLPSPQDTLTGSTHLALDVRAGRWRARGPGP